MFAEFIREIAKLATKAESPFPLNTGDPTKVAYLIGNEVKTFDARVNPRHHAVETLDDLIALADRFAIDPEASPACWFDRDRVVLVLDDRGRREAHTALDLTYTALFGRVMELQEEGPKDHKAFLRLLRVGLAGALPPAALYQKVQRVDFESGQIQRSKVGRADESLGREITGRAVTETELPEQVILSAQVYRELPFVASVACSVEVDSIRAELQLVPLPDAIDEAIYGVLRELRERLVDRLPHVVPCYNGRP